MSLKKNSLVLVTGANGYLASHIIDQLLQAGFRVRGTIRSPQKIQSLSSIWEKKFGTGRFETAIVTDMAKEGAFDEASKGVSAVAHVASNLSFNPDPNKVIPDVLEGIKSILNSALKESSIKQFVYTSSSCALTGAIPNKVLTINADTWNDADVKSAWAPPPYAAERAVQVYAASKTEGERAFWEFVKEKKPSFVANAVLPNCNFGSLLVKEHASTGGWIRDLYEGRVPDGLQGFPAQWFIDVQDTARLHVAALANPDVKNERIIAYSAPFSTTDLLSTLRKIRPEHKFPADFGDPNEKDLMKVDNTRGAQLLKDFGRDGYTTLEESLRNAIESIEG